MFALLRFFRFERMWTSALVGLVVATAHYAYVRWPTYEFLKGFPYECSYWLGGEISYTQDGALTGYAWADYFIELVRQGLHGLVAGLVFYRVWRVRSAPVVGPVGT